MSMADSNSNDAQYVTQPLTFLPILVETFFFGAYSALLVFSTILLCKRSPSRTRRAMLAISMVMYADSAAHWALVIANLQNWWLSANLRVDIAVTYLPIINYILSDGIVLWRAWVLWDRRLLLFIPPLISLLCTLAINVTSAIYLYESIKVAETNSTEVKFGLKSSFEFDLSMRLEWSTWCLTFGTNLWATSLIFVRAWQHRRFLKLLSGKETLTRNAEKALAFLIESGAFYLFIWLVYIPTSITLDPYGTSLFHTAISQIVGMYPTIIVIVVAMRLSTADILSRPGAEPNSPMVFDIMSANPPSKVTEDVEGSGMGPSP
ncbi:hypothetical protein BC827DRAFT_502912 [Russula dissimulans]|nr:hypothetical protein BC827DRAFT_502912 [Russula dissimulans]